MKVSDVMTRGVLSLAPNDTMLKAARLMMRYGVSGFPVLERGKLVGILTQGDFLRRAELATERARAPSSEAPVGELAEHYTHTHSRKVGEVATREVATVTPDASLEEAVAIMDRARVKRLPVVKDGALVGIINRANLVHAFIVNSPEPAGSHAPDNEIRDVLLNVLASELWAPREAFVVAVENGRVEFEGVICDERQRTALRVAAENTDGVREVSDHLRLQERTAG
jgi:CBS domain-containing protein